MDYPPEPIKECYWDTSSRLPRHKALYTAISKDRWDQINRYFHIWDPEDPKITNPKTTNLKITNPKITNPKPAAPDQRCNILPTVSIQALQIIGILVLTLLLMST